MSSIAKEREDEKFLPTKSLNMRSSKKVKEHKSIMSLKVSTHQFMFYTTHRSYQEFQYSMIHFITDYEKLRRSAN